MKIKLLLGHPMSLKIPHRILKIMKTTLFILFVCIFQIHAFSGKAQNAVIELPSNSITVEKLFSEIEKQTNYLVVYSNHELNGKTTIELSKKKGKVSEMLEELLKKVKLKYEYSNNYIIFSKQTEKSLPQQEKKVLIKGVVLDEKTGDPIIGANIKVSNTAIGVISDIDGNYQLEVPASATKIEISFIGFKTLEIPFYTNNINKFRVINMQEDSQALDEVTIVAFSKQKKESVIGSISTIKPAELKVPSSNLTTALAGRVAGLISYQRSGEPGKDNADFFIRGVTTFGYKADPLILIDGVEVTNTDLARLQPDDIESFSIMKDATSSALYGARGANGVILVTTKEGDEGKLKVSVRFENSIATPTQNIDIVDPITYMKMHNEAITTRNPLASQPYSQEKIDNTIAGTNPYIYPAVDWYNMLFDKRTSNQRFNMNLSGGGKVARYYIALTYNRDNGILKVDKRNNFNSNIALNKLSVRSNVNLNLTKTTEMIIRMNANFDDYNGPIDGGEGMFNKVMRANPILFPAYYQADEKNLYTNHILFGNASTANYINPYADMVKGYKEYSQTVIVAQVELKQNFDFITEGLNLRAMANTSRTSYFDLTRAYKPYYYMVDRYNKQDNTYTLRNTNESSATEWLEYAPGAKTIESSFYLEAAAQYDHVFAEKHAVGGLLVYTMKTSLVGNADNLAKSLPYRNLGLAGRFTYGYDSRYFLEGNFGYNGSERFSKDHRFGFFPSVGIGWLVSNEKFFKPLNKFFTQFKLKGTYGLVGNDAIGDSNDRFFYLSQVNQTAGKAPGFGLNFDAPNNRPTTSIDRYANNQISWEIAKKANIGIEATVLNDLNFQVEYFREDRSKILMERASITPEMGLEAKVKANIGKAFSHGIDMSMDYNKYFSNGMWLAGRFNFTYSTSQYKAYEEPAYQDAPWRSHMNHSLSQTWGFIAERLFIDEADVNNSPKQFGEYMAGDIKYHDVNKDGVINDNDLVPIGLPTSPEIIYGFGLSGGYKGFDVSFFFQGLGRESFWIDQKTTAPFIDTDDETGIISNNALLAVYANDHWSESNQNLYALWPRLSGALVDNNNKTSTWFMRDGSFLRLKQVELGYTFAERIMHKLRMNSLRIYVTGTNLLTFSNFKLWDPEMAGKGLGYPIQRTYNMGLQLSF